MTKQTTRHKTLGFGSRQLPVLDQRRLCMILDVLVLMVIAGWFVYMAMSVPRSHVDPDRSVFPIKGIDVSAHNGVIDFGRVARDSVSFVLIKATEGTDFIDSRFRHNITAASKAGLKTGVYHFFRFDSPGSQQAHHLLNTIKGQHLDLPIIIDVEKWGNPVDYDRRQVKRELRVMVDDILSRGYPVMIYTNKDGYNSLIHDDFDDIPLWLCSLSGMPPIDRWQLWQHSHEGRVNGISGKVDINTYNGDERAFYLWTRPFVVGTPKTAKTARQ